MAAIPAFLAAAESTMTAPIPAAWVAKARRECDGARRLLDDGVPRWLADESPADRAEAARLLRDAATRAAETITALEGLGDLSLDILDRILDPRG